MKPVATKSRLAYKEGGAGMSRIQTRVVLGLLPNVHGFAHWQNTTARSDREVAL